MEHLSSTELRADITYDKYGRATLSPGGKGLSKVPDAVTELSELEVLWIGYNNLTELPTSINKLKNLKVLVLHRNELSHLPAEIGDLKELTELHLGSNMLTMLPAEIGDMKELKELWVRDNRLTGVPSSIVKLKKLTLLESENNRFTELPANIGDMKELRRLNVAKNQLAEVPTSILKLEKLHELRLADNSLTMLPAEIGDMKELKMLMVSKNKLKKVPTSIIKLQKLTVLNLGSNMLTELPAKIGDMMELRELEVSNNQLEEVPTSITKLQKLTVLKLGSNILTKLPAEIGDMKELEWLYVGHNRLTVVPASVLKLKKLKKLNLDNNMLPELPAGIGDMTELRQLHMSGNPFTAEALTSLKLKETIVTDISVPAEIKARGQRAQLAYQKALSDGFVNVYRGRLLLIGQDRAGKTSLKKSLIGLPFEPNEQSTEGIEVDPSTFQVDVNQVKNWQSINENKQVLLGCSKEVVRMVVEKLQNNSDDHRCDDYSDDYSQDGEEDNDSNIKQGAEQNTDEDSEHKSTQPVLINNATSPPRKITNKLIKYFRNKLVESDIKREESIYYVDLWDFAGQHLYYASHPIFFSLRAIYVLVYNLSKSLNDTAQPCVRQGIDDVILENSNGETNVENLLSWLVTVHSITQMRGETVDSAHGISTYLRPPVIIVGTHADNPCEDIKSMTTQIQKSISGKEYARHVVPPIFGIDNTAARSQPKEYGSGQMPDKIYTPLHQHQLQQVDPETVYGSRELSWKCDNCNGGNKNATLYPYHCNPCSFDLCHSCALEGQRNPSTEIQALQDKIMEVLRQEPYMGAKIPVRWLHFEKIIDDLVAQNIHHSDIEQLQSYAKNVCFIVKEEEFKTMVNFYHDLGIIIKHCSTVILKAQWLIDLFRQLITIPQFDKMDPIVSIHWKEVQNSGVLSMELVDHVFKKFLLQDVVRDDILNMMEHFGLIAKFSPFTTDVKYFVPAQLKESPDSVCAVKPSGSDPCPLYICFYGGFVPHGLFTQLVSRFIRWCSKVGPPQSPTLYRNGAWFVIGRQVHHHFVLTCKKQFIKVVLKQKSQRRPVLGDKSTDHEVAVQVRKFVEETLQSLSQDLPYLCGLQYKFNVACPNCDLEGCLHLLEITKGDLEICKEKVWNEELRVNGLEKWSLQTTSQTLNNTEKLPGNTLGPKDEPSHLVLNDVSRHISLVWQSVGRELKVPEIIIEFISVENVLFPTVREKAFQVLKAWKNRGESVTYKELCRALKKEGLNVQAKSLLENVQAQS